MNAIAFCNNFSAPYDTVGYCTVLTELLCEHGVRSSRNHNRNRLPDYACYCTKLRRRKLRCDIIRTRLRYEEYRMEYSKAKPLDVVLLAAEPIYTMSSICNFNSLERHFYSFVRGMESVCICVRINK